MGEEEKMRGKQLLGWRILSIIMTLAIALGTFSWAIPQVEASPATIYVPDDYATIQAAVDAASPGDTIIVRDGTYIENVVVNKERLTIQSQNGAEKTIVQAADIEDHVFEVTADYVSVEGFMIDGVETGGGGSTRRKAGIWINGTDSDPVEHCNMSNNVVSNNLWGIVLYHHSSHNILTSNTVTSNVAGIFLCGSSNTLMYNIVNSNESHGIVLIKSSDSILVGNTMANNGFYNFGFNTRDARLSHFIHTIDTTNKVNGRPIYYWVDKQNEEVPGDAGYVALINCKNITVKDLTLSNNMEGVLLAYSRNCKVEGITASSNGYGILVYRSSSNTLTRNTFSNNGLGIWLRCSSDNTLTNNLVDSNTSWGIQFGWGWPPEGCTNNTLTGNTITKNGGGIWLFGTSSGGASTNNIFVANIISWNNGNAIALDFSGENLMTNNTIESNDAGIWIRESANNIIYLNNFVDNSRYNAQIVWSTSPYSLQEITYTYKGSTYTSYLGNYWDDYIGSDADGDGIGNTPYAIDGDKDNYPLMEPFENYVTGNEFWVEITTPSKGETFWISNVVGEDGELEQMKITVKAIVEGEQYEDSVTVYIRGKNPSDDRVENEIEVKRELDKLIYQAICYHETWPGHHWLQFHLEKDASGNPDPRWGLPEHERGVATGGGWGLMQITPPSSADIWSWKHNIKTGKATYRYGIESANRCLRVFKELHPEDKAKMMKQQAKQKDWTMLQACYYYNAGGDWDHDGYWEYYWAWDYDNDRWVVNNASCPDKYRSPGGIASSHGVQYAVEVLNTHRMVVDWIKAYEAGKRGEDLPDLPPEWGKVVHEGIVLSPDDPT